MAAASTPAWAAEPSAFSGLRERAGRTAWGNAGTGVTRCRASRASAPSRHWPPGSPAIGSPSRAHFPAALPSTSRLSHHPGDSPGLLMLRAGGPLRPPSLSRCRSGPTAEVVGDMHTHVTAVDTGRARSLGVRASSRRRRRRLDCAHRQSHRRMLRGNATDQCGSARA